MKINIIKKHHAYPLGKTEVSQERGKYLIQIGIAEEIKEPVYTEKKEVMVTKEKHENKKANVPTAKKKKK